MPATNTAPEKLSRASVIGWTAALLLPNLLLAAWLFQSARPHSYLAALHGLDTSLAQRLPALMLGVSALLALVIHRHRRQPLDSPPRGTAALLALVCGALLLMPALVWGAGYLGNLLSLGIGFGVLLAALALGLRLLEFPLLGLARERFASPLERLVLGSALGLGTLALALFVLGSLGLLNPWLWRVLVIGVIAAGWRPLSTLAAGLSDSGGAFFSRAHPFAIAAAAFTLLWCLSHLPLLSAIPISYDVLEYHLAAPAQYLRDGRISFLTENIYATFPQNGEMPYLLAMVLCGDKWTGLGAAHLALFAAWALSVAGVYALAARLVGGADESDRSVGPSLAALLYALIPLGSQLVSDFYVEHFQALFHLAALLAACAFLGERRAGVRDRQRWLVLAGLLAGLACGTKYTALLFTLAPLLVFLPLLCALGGSIFEGLRAAMVVAVAALVTLAPWLLRNLASSGDPIHPLGLVLQRRIAGPTSVPDRIDHFEAAHRAGEKSLAALGRALAQLWPPLDKDESHWLRNLECGPQLLCFALPGFLAPLCRRGGVRAAECTLVAGCFFADVLIWFLFSHRLNRFMYPLLGPLAALAAVGVVQLWQVQPLRKAVGALAVAIALLIAPLPMLYVSGLMSPGYMMGVESPQTAAREQFQTWGGASSFEAWQAINALPAGSKVLFLGDAQTFYVDNTPAYHVVFNPSLLEEVLAATDDPAAAARLLSARGITHIYLNFPEWLRLDTSYALAPASEPRASASGPAGWQLAQWDPKRREIMGLLLGSGQIGTYGLSWPPEVHPAYLKLAPDGYPTLEALLRDFTTVESVWHTARGAPSCELRRLAPSPVQQPR